MDDYKRYLNKKLENPEFKKEWDALETEAQIMHEMVKARLEAGMTQKQLSEKTGINQSNLSRIENGDGNPSVATLERIASALGKKVSGYLLRGAECLTNGIFSGKGQVLIQALMIAQSANEASKAEKGEKFSTFMLCGMLLLIIIVTLIYFLIIYYKPEYIVKYSGYAVKENVIEKNLKAENIEEVEKYVEMVKVEEDNQIFRKLNTYYVGGENQKEQITIQYPIYVNGKASIYNILGDMKLITVNYEEVEGYPEFVITEGVMYNGDDLTRADSNEYLFLKNEEDIYINTKEITIKTSNEEYKIPEYSTIYFEEGRINYYETQEGIMEFKSIGNMDKTSNILLNGTTMTYEEFLIKMGIVQEEKENVRPNKTEETSETKPTESTETPATEPTEEPVTEPPVEENGEQNQEENQYIKPSITMTEIEANVYTLTGKIEIQDPVGAIYKLPIIEIRKNGRIYKRVQIKASGTIEITGLSPDTEFEITGIM